MSSLLSDSEKTSITGELFNLFQTLSRPLVIHKEPLKTIIENNSSNNIYGYEESSQQTNYTYTPISGFYSAVVRYGYRDQKTDTFYESKVSIPKGQCRIKVMESGRNFILDGTKTESIIVDDNKFNIISSDGVKEHFGLKFYYFMLERTN